MQILPRDLLTVAAVMGSILLLTNITTRKPKRTLPCCLSALCCSVLMAVVFSLAGVSPISGFHTEIRPREINLIPFVGMLSMIREGVDWYSVTNIAGNILMFAPLGFFAPLLCPKLDRPARAVALGFLVSLGIECTQLFLSRGSDIDDLILNTLGALIGYGAYAVCRRLFPGAAARVKGADGTSGAWLLALCILVPYAVIVLFGFYDRAVFFGM